MTDNQRSVRLERTAPRRFRATNAAGVSIELGEGGDEAFTPVELLLVAIAGCSAVDIDYITARRAEPLSFEVTSSASKLADDLGNHLADIALDLRIAFPEGEDGDRARDVLARAAALSRDRLCTVSRTVQLGTPVTYRLDGEDV